MLFWSEGTSEQKTVMNTIWEECGLSKFFPEIAHWSGAADFFSAGFSVKMINTPRLDTHIENADKYFALGLYDTAKLAYFNAILDNEYASYAIDQYIKCAQKLDTLAEEADSFDSRIDELTQPQFVKFFFRLSKALKKKL
jgi:hypothetical protein